MKTTAKATHLKDEETEDHLGNLIDISLFIVTEGEGSGGVFALDASFLDQIAERETEDDEKNLIVPNPFSKVEAPENILLEYTDEQKSSEAKTEGEQKNQNKLLPPTPPTRKGKSEIKYRWCCNQFFQGIPDELWDILKEVAITHANSMAEKGFTSGQLIEYVSVKIEGVQTPEEGFYCTGWFEIQD